MSISNSESILPDERNLVLSRARIYVLVRGAVDLLALALALVQPPSAQAFPLYWLVLADLAGLALYWLAVRRWPAPATYFQLIYAAVLLIALDFGLGYIGFYSWLLLIPLGLTGGLIVARPGFNSLVSLTLLGLWAAYIGLLLLGRVTLPAALSIEQLATASIVIVVIIILQNALAEMLVMHLYHLQEDLVQTQVKLLHAQAELELYQRETFTVQKQVRQFERLSAIGQIATQVGKSLQEPLSTIQKDLELPPEALARPEVIQELRQQLDNVLQLLDGLRCFASLGHMQPQTINLDDILSKEISQLSLPDGVRLRVEQPPVFPPIQADPEHMRLLVRHLLENAILAVSETGGDVTVSLNVAPEGVRLTVSDTGPGIPADKLDLIFEPLYTTRDRGFGLGLPLVQQIVQLHGGHIKVTSKEGEGSTFSVYLPRVPRHVVEELAEDMAA
ncbi:MAG: hypothetical protein GXP42_05225 [Chloroflexi bacterium]|nr:hypothetical protein [Chloroflexota bacterium]